MHGQIPNLVADLTGVSAAHEQIDAIVARPGLRIERIVSTGQASPPGFWYDQPEDEWVLLLTGAARLRLADEVDARSLAPGDHVLIPAHVRHRVDWTSPAEATVWLAVYMAPEPRGG